MISPRKIFRFIYGSFYFILCVLTAALLLVTPGDAIYKAYQNKQQYNIWILAAALALTVVIISFIYALRLYNNKTILASIPKSWVPIEKGDVPKKVFEMITSGLDRSAAVTFEARPRLVADRGGTDQAGPSRGTDEQTPSSTAHGIQEREQQPLRQEEKQEEGQDDLRKDFQLLKIRRRESLEKDFGAPLPPHHPVWGEIEHGGWASPDSPDLANLQYSTVLSELPHLVEAKALTHAPPDPAATPDQPILDADAVALLERPVTMGLREYLTHLSDIGVLSLNESIAEFLSLYEHARFSTQAMTNAQFRDLMRLFSTVLRDMGPLDPAILDAMDEDIDDGGDNDNDGRRRRGGDEAATPTESDIDNDAPIGTNPTTPRSTLSRSATQSTRGSRRQPYYPARRHISTESSGWPPSQYATAPSAQSIDGGSISRTSTMDDSVRRVRRQQTMRQRQQYPYHAASNASLRSAASSSGASGTSVIRLAGRTDATDLPYVLTMMDSR